MALFSSSQLDKEGASRLVRVGPHPPTVTTRF